MCVTRGVNGESVRTTDTRTIPDSVHNPTIPIEVSHVSSIDKANAVMAPYYKSGPTFLSVSCSPGASVMQAATVPSRSITAYMMRVDVELRQDGHAEQHRPHAALPQQHANCNVSHGG